MPNSSSTNTTESVQYNGWLHKWTNYIHGYQKRYFMIENDYLSYYRSDAENQSCRGRLKLSSANFHIQSSTMFCVTSGTQNYTLKAQNETHRQRWITNLELAKTQAKQNRKDRINPPKPIRSTTSDLSINSSHQSLIQTGLPLDQPLFDQISLSSIESFDDNFNGQNSISSSQIKSALIELKTSYDTLKSSPSTYFNKSKEFYKLAVAFEQHQKHLLDKERKKREEIEHRLEELATQHLNFERRVVLKENKDTQNFEEDIEEKIVISDQTINSRSNTLSEGDDDEFEDALSDGFEFEDILEALPSGQGDIKENIEAAETPQNIQQKIETGDISPEVLKIVTRNRRKIIMPRASHSLNLWNLIKNFVGQDLSRIPMPVNFNEPLSMIQRFAEGMEYYDLLDKAATIDDPCEQMLYVLAFSMSPYSTTRMRINKPFNPLLGETFEVDRYHEKEGYRLVVEQTSHHPPAASTFVESRKGWSTWNHTTVTSKFRGNLLSVTPIGLQHIYFENNKQHYSYDRITTTAHNIIVGKLWMDQSGELTCWNHTSGDKCVLKYHPYSYFSRDPPRRVSGLVYEKKKARYVVTGDWDAKMQYREIQGEQKGKSKSGQPQYKTSQPVDIWKKTSLQKLYEKTEE